MAAFEVTPSQLKNVAEQLQTLNEQFKTAVDNLQTTQQSLSAMWEGETKQAFQNAFNKDKLDMEAFNVNITKYVAALQAMAIKYEQAENANTETARTRSY